MHNKSILFTSSQNQNLQLHPITAGLEVDKAATEKGMKERLITVLFGGARDGAKSRVGDIGLLLMRVLFGLTMAFAHGAKKVPPTDGFIGGVEAMGFPLPAFFAWSAGLAELAGGILLALGLTSRPAAFFLLQTMIVAVFIKHGADPFKKQEMGLLYGTFATSILLLGAGRFSLDHLVRNKLMGPSDEVK